MASDESPSSEEIKPTYRGLLHKASFIFYLALFFIITFFARPGLPRITTVIYLVTLITLYGVSSCLHVTDWKKPKLEARLQRIDHACIFLLIAGTYTPVCTCFLPLQSWTTNLLIAAWTIALAGVAKCLLFPLLPKFVNVSFYFLCGLTIVPYFPKMLASVSIIDLIFFITGGVLYLAGGMIFGLEYPDPAPHVFGYHEIFHVLTIVANLSFLVPILKSVL